jgi:hypothetical protein
VSFGRSSMVASPVARRRPGLRVYPVAVFLSRKQTNAKL